MNKIQNKGHCSECGKTLTGSLCYTYDGKSYCYDCFQILSKQLETQENKKQQLYSYVKQIFRIKEMPEFVISNIENLLDKGKTINGIQKTLYYYYEILDKELPDINKMKFLVNQYYEETKKYFIKQSKIKEANEGFTDKSKKITIKIDPNELFKKAQDKKKIINIEDL